MDLSSITPGVTTRPLTDLEVVALAGAVERGEVDTVLLSVHSVHDEWNLVPTAAAFWLERLRAIQYATASQKRTLAQAALLYQNTIGSQVWGEFHG